MLYYPSMLIRHEVDKYCFYGKVLHRWINSYESKVLPCYKNKLLNHLHICCLALPQCTSQHHHRRQGCQPTSAVFELRGDPSKWPNVHALYFTYFFLNINWYVSYHYHCSQVPEGTKQSSSRQHLSRAKKDEDITERIVPTRVVSSGGRCVYMCVLSYTVNI